MPAVSKKAASHVMSTKQRTRAKAMAQCCDPAWVRRALAAGITQQLIDLRKLVCGMETHEINFIIGLTAGDEGDNDARTGDPIPKCAKLLQHGRAKGQKDKPGLVRKKKGDRAEQSAKHVHEPPPPPEPKGCIANELTDLLKPDGTAELDWFYY